MPKKSEIKRFAKKFSDLSRKAILNGNTLVIPHKVKNSGVIVTHENFDARVDLSKLSLKDLAFLETWMDTGWDFEKTCRELGITEDQAKWSYNKVRYFEFEDKKVKALAKVPTPEFVAAKNLEGFYRDNYSDGQRDHLKELAKITGAYKPTVSINAQVQLEKPDWTPEQEAKLREVYDTIALEEPHAS